MTDHRELAANNQVRFASLGSGSKGNGTLVAHADTCVLVDCGFSSTRVIERLARLEMTLDDLDAIVVTHEHADHIGGVARLARKTGLPVWMTAGTADQCRDLNVPELNFFSSHEAFDIGDLHCEPFPVPHDAREPSQFVFGDGDKRLGMLTDVGSATPHITEMLSGCDALILECNYDEDMLMNGSYPQSLKTRVAGDFGHLSNEQAGAILQSLDNSRLQHIVAAHLSEENNSELKARATLASVLGCEYEWVAVAKQESGLPWREIV